MQIRRDRGGAEATNGKKRPEESRQPAPGEIEPDWVSKDENSLSIQHGSELLFRPIFPGRRKEG